MLLVLLAAGALFAQDAQPKAEGPAQAFSVLPSFGTGQYYVGANGIPFLTADVVSWAGWVAGIAVEYAAAYDPSLYSISPYEGGLVAQATGLGIVLAGGLVVLVFSNVDRAKKAGKVAEIVPVFTVQCTSFGAGVLPVTSLELGVALKY